jgi:hypothetical protein
VANFDLSDVTIEVYHTPEQAWESLQPPNPRGDSRFNRGRVVLRGPDKKISDIASAVMWPEAHVRRNR